MNLKIPQKPQIDKGAEMVYKMENLEQKIQLMIIIDQG